MDSVDGVAGFVAAMSALGVAAAVVYAPSRRALAALGAPRLYVVRVVDYVAYREERVVYAGRFVVSCLVVGLKYGRAPALGLVKLCVAAAAQVFVQEVGLQLAGQRAMDMRKYEGGRLAFLPPAVRMVGALAVQAFFEGAVYFGSLYAYAFLMLERDVPWLVAGAAAWATFPLWCLRHGWPRPRAYGAKALSRREIASTVPSRAVQAVVAVAAWRATPRPPAALAACVAYAALGVFPYYFGAIRALGRSFVELERPGARGAAPPAWLDALCMAYRAAEPVVGSFCALALYARFEPLGGLGLGP